MSNVTEQSHLPKDPKQWVKDLEAIWKAHDGDAASKGYTDDAVLHWGANQVQSGDALRERPGKWFSFATDLQIDKKYIAHTNDCIVTTWDSKYTDPDTGKTVFERGIEYFYFREGLVCEQHAWQSSWNAGDDVDETQFSTA
ncbi:hypothetical protein WH95_15500 [Kiloniella litopenaei]|uniref:SnoaL-like domain-containing protein n=1 Tax=Kiloniella litopenaei TaxID=1549748 RepID=A0A0M2R8S9_9PROT|nr:nuclear transport factor 2 family protein [Kiloniella litopenaei]KKJ75968.1 hypothetical protein WH95_15500 [Kiloniella litopenaei]